MTAETTVPPQETARSAPSRAPSRSPAASPDEAAVVITGIVGRLGKRLARKLHRDRKVIGLDRRPFDGCPKDIEHHQIDIRRKKTRDIFRTTPIAAVVHLGVMHDPRTSAAEHHLWNVIGFQKVLEYVAQYSIPKLVLLSSANVYGPRPENAQFLTEDAPLLGGAAFSEIRDLVEIDMLAQSFFWKRPETETVILRPVHIVGTVRNAPSNYLRLPVVPTLLGFDPMMQLIHEDDVVRAIELSLQPGMRGIFNVAGPPPVPLSHVIKAAGRPSLPIPHPLARSMLSPLWRLRVASFPAPELDHIRYVCMVDDRRARETMSYAPTRSLEDAVKAVDEDRWP
ncbi:MAG TPA: NAD-dependent epimerase/dehydratase family protein [Polyangiaceae bacterium]|nr:NAD-dependent epimerase/dehydratase family protein [Polyangiaceae bacterium]